MRESIYVKKVKPEKAFLWKNRSPLLHRLDIEITERCNNNCLHCYINLPKDDYRALRKELSTQDLQDLLLEAASLGCLTVRFTGGEPLLRRDFEKLYVFTRKLGIQVIIFTNATLITPQLAELFVKIPPLKKIEISVYGMKKESYEGVTRVSGSFNAAWRGIHLLLDNKIPFIVKSALLPSNEAERKQFEAWASKIPWMNGTPAYSMFFDLHCRQDKRKSQLIKTLRMAPEKGIKILSRNNDDYFKTMAEFCSRFTGISGDILFTCRAGIRSGSVDAYGFFQPCLLLRHPEVLYNLRNGSLRDALVNFFPRLMERRAENPEYLNRCSRCFLRGLCDMCPAKSWLEHGTLDTPVEYVCEIAHAQARYLKLLKENEKAWEIPDGEIRMKKFSGEKMLNT